MLNSLSKNIYYNLGVKTKRKIVVFLIDDYGSIRMSSRIAFKALNDSGLKLNSRYNRFETIESNSDLELLFEVLTKFKDKNGNHPVITPVVCVANPDFDRIKASDFTNYFYEPFTETLKRYPQHDRVFDLWKTGIDKKIFTPQFHGREHLNINRWMTDLRNGVTSTRLAFDYKVTGIGSKEAKDILKDYQAAFDIDHPEEIHDLGSILSEGLKLFEELLGYKAIFFTPTNGLFNHKLDQTLKEQGILLLNVDKTDKEPQGNGRYKRVFHFMGEKNNLGQHYIVRNALFEPSEPANFDWIDRCLNDIKMAFRWQKPSIISSHRVNFSGHLFPDNRYKGLSDLEKLLRQILLKWPEAEFLSIDSMNKIIFQKNSAERD